jgi:hypothetical protein
MRSGASVMIFGEITELRWELWRLRQMQFEAGQQGSLADSRSRTRW